MYRLAVGLAGATLLLSGCGSDSASGDDAKEPAAPKTSSASYFSAEDTAALNRPSANAQEAGAKARAQRSVAACNKIDAYPAWRSCWHGLLDPYVKGLTGLAGAFTSLAVREFPTACVEGLEGAAQTFAGFAGKVDALLTGIDSNNRAAQVKSTTTYIDTLDRITTGFAKPFQDITQVCYSPEDLASINASPTPSP